MEVDICHNKDCKVWCKEPKDQGIYLRPLVTLYGQVVLKKLFKNCTNRPPLSLSWMICKMKLPGKEDKTAVAVGTRTDDVNPAQPHQILHVIQGPEVGVAQRLQSEPWLLKINLTSCLVIEKILDAKKTPQL
uniref:Large ribosomal subunit protein uL15/eL18 domain-containing protein n=1 Tax=Panthera leo TaxID=9689 RepID=A0A8C8XFJ4_PANLE